MLLTASSKRGAVLMAFEPRVLFPLLTSGTRRFNAAGGALPLRHSVSTTAYISLAWYKPAKGCFPSIFVRDIPPVSAPVA